jgi:hypothetical protein
MYFFSDQSTDCTYVLVNCNRFVVDLINTAIQRHLLHYIPGSTLFFSRVGEKKSSRPARLASSINSPGKFRPLI